jgi:hypothetical protein
MVARERVEEGGWMGGACRVGLAGARRGEWRRAVE